MIHTLEDWKKRKNYIANSKGYKIDPEKFSINYLLLRFKHEYEEEFKPELANYYKLRIKNKDTTESRDKLISELSDMSNIIDYLSSKLISNIQDEYIDEKG